MNIDKIEIVKNGPIRILADHIQITHHDGTEIEKEDRVSLCRCGLSQKQPFCDGAHKEAKPFEE